MSDFGGHGFWPTILGVILGASLLLDVLHSIRRWRRAAAKRAALESEFKDLKDRLWQGNAICDGVADGTAALIARAARAARAAAAAKELAITRLEDALKRPMRDPGVPGIAELAIEADRQVQVLLGKLAAALPDAEAGQLRETQECWQRYRDAQVTLCRQQRQGRDDFWPARHYASDAITLARVADLEDLLAAAHVRTAGGDPTRY